MQTEIYVTENEMDILDYIQDNGGYQVSLCPRNVKQNKNFYRRVRKLEELGFISVLRYDGRPSDISITTEGIKYYHDRIGGQETTSDTKFILDLISASSLSPTLKEKIICILS
jgi:hypothetical protein